MLNKQGENKIDWCDWSWNPITGCYHNCEYCYMKRMKRFDINIMQYKYKREYLKDLKSKKLKKGNKIFVGSSGDMFGNWVHDKYIVNIIQEITKYPEYIFIFLTKNPKRYQEFCFPVNCWLGTSIDSNNMSNFERFCDFMQFGIYNKHNIRFISFEPLLEEYIIDESFINKLDWIIVGANSNKGSKKPPNIWADNLIKYARENNIKIWVKDNYKYHTKIKEFPGKDNEKD